MLTELFQAVCLRAESALRPVVFHPEAEPDHCYCLATPDGKVQWREARPEPRDHHAADPETVARWALGHADAYTRVAVWYDRTGVVALLDDATRRDRVSLRLAWSPQIEFLRRLETAKPVTQKAFIRMLRVELAGCLSDCPSLLPAARDLRFHQHADGTSEVKPGAVSIGKRLQAQVTGVEKLPEEVSLFTPVFAAVLTDPFEVRCAVDVDPEPATPTLQLVPLPGLIERAVQEAERELQRRLRSLLFGTEEKPNVSLSYGSP